MCFFYFTRDVLHASVFFAEHMIFYVLLDFLLNIGCSMCFWIFC